MKFAATELYTNIVIRDILFLTKIPIDCDGNTCADPSLDCPGKSGCAGDSGGCGNTGCDDSGGCGDTGCGDTGGCGASGDFERDLIPQVSVQVGLNSAEFKALRAQLIQTLAEHSPEVFEKLKNVLGSEGTTISVQLNSRPAPTKARKKAKKR